MKLSILPYGILFLAAATGSAQTGPPPMPDTLGPNAPRVQVQESVALAYARVRPNGSTRVLALEGSQSAFAVLVSTTEDASVSCTVATPGPKPVELASGESWVPKGRQVSIALTQRATVTPPPGSYDVSCTPRFLTPAGTPANENFVANLVPPIPSYSIISELEPVKVLATNDVWKPTFDMSQPGTLTLIFDDTVPGLASSYDTNPGPSPMSRELADPVQTSILAENTYYRYHFTGASAAGNWPLAQQNKTYLLYKSTTPQLSTPVSLTSQLDGIDVKFGLTRKVDQLQLQFPSGVGLKPKSQPAGGEPTWVYEFVIPTDLEAAASSIGAPTVEGIKKSLNDATTSGGTETASGTLKLSIVDFDVKGAPPIAQLELSVVRVGVLPLINALKSQNGRLGLDKATAQGVANTALGITDTSSQEDRDAAAALVGLLMQKGSSSNFKNNLVALLVTVGKTVAKAYGIPVP